MIVQKFGGTSVADAERILGVVDVVRRGIERRPLVVVSALAGVTDLLLDAVAKARAGEREAIEPVLVDLGRRHRWAVSGAVRDSRRRHDLSLEVDGLLEELRVLLRSMRLLGEGTPRSADAILAFGEILSSRILATAMDAEGLRAVPIDPREVLVTDGRHGAAEPDIEATSTRLREALDRIGPKGGVPVVGGFVGATRDGRTTTLGRGGSDTSASVFGAAVGAEEIEIWTDVDGILTADPRIVPAARLRPSVGFVEAAELAHHGAKVLHPASIAPAVKRGIPVRVRNSARPEGEGTVVLAEPARGAPALASIASRTGLRGARAASARMRRDPTLSGRLVEAIEEGGGAVALAIGSDLSARALWSGPDPAEFPSGRFSPEARVEIEAGKGIVSVVGWGLASDRDLRARVLATLASIAPEALVAGASAAAAVAVIPDHAVPDAVRSLHREFFEGGAP